MHILCVRMVVAGAAVVALSGQASPSGMALPERVKVADFIGVVRIQAIHPAPDAGRPAAERQDWFLRRADAVVTETIKGVSIPSRIVINFDNGQAHDSLNVEYAVNGEYLVFLAIEGGGGYSTCVQGQYAIRDSTISGWPGAAAPVRLDAARSTISKLLPPKRDA